GRNARGAPGARAAQPRVRRARTRTHGRRAPGARDLRARHAHELVEPDGGPGEAAHPRPKREVVRAVGDRNRRSGVVELLDELPLDPPTGLVFARAHRLPHQSVVPWYAPAGDIERAHAA